jgi:hypothetical protein
MHHGPFTWIEYRCGFPVKSMKVEARLSQTVERTNRIQRIQPYQSPPM